ncbi:MAG: phage major capsid protein [Syntrophobacterales bacterium]|nr:phage major capsid protein [Syntrophobacterales bacterium]
MSSLYDVKQLLQEIADELPELKRRVEELESKTRVRKWAAGGNTGGDDMGRFSLFKALRGLVTGNWSDASHEREVLHDYRTRDMGASPDSAGGYLVPSQEVPELIEMLRAESVVSRAGATWLTDLKGSPVTLPKQTAGATAYWVAENAPITPSDLAFGQVVLTPRKAAAMVKLSNELLNLSLPQAEAVVRRDLVEQISLAIDLAALRGSGTAGQPTGVANTAGINSVALGQNGGYLTSLDLFFDMIAELEEDNALRGKLAFICHPKVKGAMRKLKAPQYEGDQGGLYQLPPLVVSLLSTDRALEEAVGHPIYASTQIPTDLTKGSSSNCIYFGNWQDLLIAQWGGLSILASPHAGDAFAKDQTWVRVTALVDIAVRHPESFCLCSDLRVD